MAQKSNWRSAGLIALIYTAGWFSGQGDYISGTATAVAVIAVAFG